MTFEHLTPNHYHMLSPFFKEQTFELCYYSLSSLIAWSHSKAYTFYKRYNNLLVLGRNFPQKPHENHLLMPMVLSGWAAPSDLITASDITGIDTFWNIPEGFVKKEMDHLSKEFEISGQPKYHDYIFKTSDLALLKGRKYSKKRNLVNQFVKEVWDKETVEIHKITKESAKRCKDFLDSWWQKSGFDASNEDAAGELAAAKNALDMIDAIELKGVYLSVNNEIKAYGIGSRLTDTIGGFHFEKADPDIKGLYQFFDQQCARRLFSDHYEWINKECDMGLPGLAQAKKSYYPDRIEKSYLLQRKSS